MAEGHEIRDIFQKDITRNINGVIQAGQLDEQNVQEELAEYVVTPELQEALTKFFHHYVGSLQSPTAKMGVWISGFFGSGKSHFLKILSYLLENRRVGEKTALEYFDEKALSHGLRDLLRKVSTRPAATLLFNIDSQSSSNSVQRAQPIVEVLLKVFNRHLGYSETLWIADIERQFERAGVLLPFREAFAHAKGVSWDHGRQSLLLNRQPFVEAARAVGMDSAAAELLLEGARRNFEVSPDSLAGLLGEYCEQHGPDFRLVFLIDEAGQYIAGQTALMLNLQTVVEDLGNRAHGQVWVIVTSQENIESVTTVQGEDFSKIQGRFATRINLSSINTDEVIKERLLQKTEWAAQALESHYDQSAQSLKNMLSFSTPTPGLSAGYASAPDFVASYPCVPYQYDLLQHVFEKVRTQGEAGKHLAHGERSLLKSFQESVRAIETQPLGHLVPFSAFYDTIEDVLDSAIKKTVRKAEARPALHDHDVAVLKVLYLIKNIQEMPATVENVTTLLIDRIDAVKATLTREIQASVDRLTYEQLIQQNADHTYTFLSDDEQEVNREIQHVHLAPGELDQQIGARIFNDLLKGQEKAHVNQRDFAYGRQFEGRLYGMSHADLKVHIRVAGDGTAARLPLEAIAEPNTLTILLPPGPYQDTLERAKKIQQYVQNTMGTHQDPQRTRIVEQKQTEISAFEIRAEKELADAARHAVFYILGQESQFPGDFFTQFNAAMDRLVHDTYPHLEDVTEPLESKQAVHKILEWAQTGRPFSTVGVNERATEAMTAYLERQHAHYQRASLQDIKEYFAHPPYGWSPWDVSGVMALLLGQQRITLQYNGAPLTAVTPKFADTLIQTSAQGKIVVDLIVAMPVALRAQVAKILRTDFGYSGELDDSFDGVARTIRGVVHETLGQPLEYIEEIARQESGDYPYPGAATIRQLKAAWSFVAATADPETLVNAFVAREEHWGEEVEALDDLKAFYLKSPRERFDEAVHRLQAIQADVTMLSSYPAVISTIEALKAILRDQNPYGKIPQIPGLLHTLQETMAAAVQTEREKNQSELTAVTGALEPLRHQYPTEGARIEEARRTLAAIQQRYEAAESITIILASVTQARSVLQELQNALRESSRKRPEPPHPPEDPQDVSFTQVLAQVSHSHTVRIATEAELLAYLQQIEAQCRPLLASHCTIVIHPGGDDRE